MLRFINAIHIIIIILCSFSQVFGSIGSYPIINYSPDEYKAGIQNIDFAQNRDMSLFVANNLGVLSYNGIEWHAHDFKTGKKKRSLAFDHTDNRLYVGSQGDFGYYDKDWSYHSLKHLIPSSQWDFDEVWDVFIVDTGVYFCTFQSIFIYFNNEIKVIEREGGFDRSIRVNDEIYTQTPKGRIFQISNHQLTNPTFSSPENEILTGIIPLDQGYILFYNSGNIIYSSPFGLNDKFEALKEALTGTYVNHVLQLSDTRIAISTQTSGLYIFDIQQNSIEQISTEQGLQSNACLRSFQDYNGNLWVGLQNGISLIDINAPVRFIDNSVNLVGSGYEAFDGANGSYFTTTSGIYYLPKNSTKSIFIEGTEGPSYSLREIDGRLYAGHHTGLFLLDNGKATRLSTTNGIWDIKPLQSFPGYVIAGTYTGLYIYSFDENDILQPSHKINGFDESSRFFFEDKEGKILVSQYYKGLFRLSLNDNLTEVEIHQYPNEFNASIGEQIILGEIDNKLYLGTNRGLFQFDPVQSTIDSITPFSDVIDHQPVYLFKQDSKKNIHIITENRVGFFKPQSMENYIFVPSSVYQRRYFFNNDLLQISEMTDGVMFSANEGFINYKPENENRTDIDPPIMIKRIYSVTEDKNLYYRTSFASSTNKLEKLNFGSKSKILQFEVESFQFNKGESLEFRYQLEGLEDNYGEWTYSSTKDYTNLIHGNYTFKVQSKNQLGDIISNTPLDFSVSPPFYKSIFARILYFLIGIGFLLVLARFQKKKYNKRTRLLEEESKLRLAEKQRKILQMEQQKKEELRRLEEEKMKGELRQINNQLAASTMNLVAKNEFIKNIRSELKEIEKLEIKEPTQRAIQKIEKEIDLNLRLQEDWDQFEFHFDKVHGDFMQRLRSEFKELSPNDQKLCTFLRLNLSTKEITNLMGISQRGIEIARYRLRKKLNLDKGQNLAKFILEY